MSNAQLWTFVAILLVAGASTMICAFVSSRDADQARRPR